MPIYEYRCDVCGALSETLQKADDPPLRDCPKCGSPSLKRVISATVFRLKGSGWYETDFKSASRHNVYGEEGPTDASVKPETEGKPKTEGQAQTEGAPKEATPKPAPSTAPAQPSAQPVPAKPKAAGTQKPASPGSDT